jgi:hypothetical protein
LKKSDDHGFWEEILQRFPRVNAIVDSSKDPFWIRQQAEYLARRGIEVRHILIWKTPRDFAIAAQTRPVARPGKGMEELSPSVRFVTGRTAQLWSTHD